MKKIFLRQTGVCILIVLALVVSMNSRIPILEKGADAILKYISEDYSAEDMKAAVEKGKYIAAYATGKVGEAVSVIAGKPVYGEPIDEEYEGGETPVHAVAAGQVTAVGENEEIGKYIGIIHANQAESLYGNLKSIMVEVPSNVKKGQIIGVYEKNDEKDFYYSLKEK